MPTSLTAHLKGNKYVTSIHCAVSGMVKLSKVTRIPDSRKVYRGMSSMRLPREFWIEDEHSARGGVEYGFLSTTTKREVAMQVRGIAAHHLARISANFSPEASALNT